MALQNGKGPTTAAADREPLNCKPDQLRALHIEIPRRIQSSRVQLLAGRLHALGPRATFELLLELIEGADVVDRLEVYAGIDRDFLHALGGDVLPPHIREIGGAS
jgi:hypothetical protein